MNRASLSCFMSGPEFFCVGAQKAGTTWLHSQMEQHPDVWLPHVKELHYFDTVHLGIENDNSITKAKRRLEALSRRKAPRVADVEYFKTILEMPRDDAWYAHIFSKGAGRVRGDFTPSYCMIGEDGARHMQRVSPSAKIIYLVRDPVARMISSLQMTVMRGIPLTIDLLERPSFRSRGDYAENVPVWDKVFGDDVLYVPFGDIKSMPLETLRGIEAFIGIEPFDGYAAVGEPVHVSRKLVMPDELTERVHEICARQYGYLLDRFGADFLRRTV